MKKIAFLCPYPVDIAPGQRYRFELFLKHLEAAGCKYSIYSFIDAKTNAVLYKKGYFFQKAWGILKGYLRRINHLFRLRNKDFVFIHREAAPLGPPIFEWIIARVMKKKIIYDFDDAIWIPTISEANKIAEKFKWYSKVGRICKWAYKISAGNEYLASYSRKFNKNVFIIPSVVDISAAYTRVQNQDVTRPAIGWSGTFSTLKHLRLVMPSLTRLQEEYDFNFYVIADTDPSLQLKNYKFIRWNRGTETDDLMNFHIGLMPLIADKYAEGKCGLKAIQYMGLGIPAVVSPLGVNSKIVDNGINGYHCNTESEWTEKLKTLLAEHSLRIQMGKAARDKVRVNYSADAIKSNFIGLFN